MDTPLPVMLAVASVAKLIQRKGKELPDDMRSAFYTALAPIVNAASEPTPIRRPPTNTPKL